MIAEQSMCKQEETRRDATNDTKQTELYKHKWSHKLASVIGESEGDEEEVRRETKKDSFTSTSGLTS